jgi:glycerol kinase
MEKDSGVALTSLKVDGGMVANELLMQFQADVLGVPVVRPVVTETTALGAAYAAGLAVGFWEDLDALRRNWGVDKVFEPGMAAEKRAALYAGWQKAVQRTLDWVGEE